MPTREEALLTAARAVMEYDYEYNYSADDLGLNRLAQLDAALELYNDAKTEKEPS